MPAADPFSSRVNRRFLDIELRLQGKDGLLHTEPGVTEAAPEQRSYIDDKIERYRIYLEKAYAIAPCQGCKQLVMGALVGHAIFLEMSKTSKSRAELTDEEIERIKTDVEKRYKNY